MADSRRPGVDGEQTSVTRDGGTAVGETGFGPAVAPRHRRLDASEWDDIYVVGDVHGCLTDLERLLDRLDPGCDDLVAFVGDLVRKGPDSAGVVDLVRSRPNFHTVQGNNEAKVAADPEEYDDYAGLADYCRSLPLALSWGDALVVHGGVDPRRSLADQTPDDLLETRAIPPENGYDGPFWFESYQGPPRVFFGHTVLDDPVVDEWAVGLDTGCVYGGSLTAYDYRRDELVSVPATREYQPRADRKVLSL